MELDQLEKQIKELQKSIDAVKAIMKNDLPVKYKATLIYERQINIEFTGGRISDCLTRAKKDILMSRIEILVNEMLQQSRIEAKREYERLLRVAEAFTEL